MKKLLLICLSTMMVLGALGGCAAKKTDETPVERTVVDMKGKEVVLPDEIEKYCVLYSSAVPMAAMVDKDLEHMVMYPISNYFEYWYKEMFEGIDDHAIQVDKKNVTAEQILESGAQVVFWNRPAHEELVASLEEAGVACVNVQVSNSEDLIHAVHVVADTLGTEFAKDSAQKYEDNYGRYLSMATECASKISEEDKRTVLVIGEVNSPNVGPIDSYQGYWTELTGLKNLTPVEPGQPSATLTMEEIYDIDPDIIISQGPINRTEINADEQWSQVRALKEGMLFANPSILDEWGMPTTEAPLQFLWVLKQFYPEYSKDIDLTGELIAFYKDFYDYEMSVENAEAILSCHHFYIHEALQCME